MTCTYDTAQRCYNYKSFFTEICPETFFSRGVGSSLKKCKMGEEGEGGHPNQNIWNK